MAIQFRRGAFADFVKSKMVAGEPAVVQSGDTSTQNGKAFYICYTPGSVDRVLTEQDKTALDSQISDIEDDLAAAEQTIESVRQSIPAVDATLTTTGAAADAKKTGDEISDLKSDLTNIEDQFSEINGKIFPPSYEFGSRYVSNGADAYASNTVRMSFERGYYITLKAGDLVTKASTVIQYFGGGYSTNNGSSFTSISAQSSVYTAPVDGIYFFWLSKPSDAEFTDTDIANASTYLTFTREGSLLELKEKEYVVTMSVEQFPEINGVIVPPPFEIGTRYVNNGADTWLTSTIRLSFKKGTYISLKEGDVVSKASSVYAFGGGYTTDNGLTFTAISNRTADYTAPADGLYFFCLSKSNDAEYTTDEIETGWKLITFTRPSNMKTTLDSLLDLSNTVDDIQTAIGYEIAPLVPSDYLAFPNTNKGLNYLGNLVDDTAQDATDYIAIDGLYDIFRIVSNETKWSLGVLCYYTESKQFIRRDLLGATYDFSIYNGEKGVWLGIDKTVQNAKYIRYSGDNARGFKYWEVRYGAKASAFDEYYKYPFLGKKIVNFGDSIFGQTRPPKDVSTYLANKTGATVYNAGFGGCEMSTHADSNYNPFSMCNLADAIASGTWTTQESAASASGMPAYFAETVTMLKSLDFSTIDIITIAYGTNDWNNSSPLDNGGNSNMAYFADALRHSIETLLTAFPQLRIFICTPIYRWWMDSQGQFTDDSNTRVNPTTNTKLTDFVAKTIEVAEEYQLPYINDYEIGMNRYNRSYYFYSTDGTHPKPEGNKLIADNIASKIY